ncbi:nitroreductase family deazaflavin-dependent oxidoreductase [Hoyosella altamirensis]|uniref:Deazaflavin-dependent oxidoreductase (Nitroreductase family) n=1 Tax=Hoyosella altamirensis TaxID=616997 RepID=A0A839RTY4_9ACTN|nr:nitroreductase family deazaflavin-dependent oxidoreductase [Hoyosella altamirensis]MBB3039686.1 deazaflavin-dependent oxidoreductase (nitroreductase family) [Hoyosella altamirensis]
MKTSSEIDRLRRKLRPFNKVIVGLQRCGIAIGTMHVLSVRGRKSGQMHSTPVSPLTVDGVRYIVAGFEHADWVKNVRAAQVGELSKGRKEQAVKLTELPREERAPILRAFPREVPHGVQFFVRTGVTAGPDPESFAAAADRCPVFRVEPIQS